MHVGVYLGDFRPDVGGGYTFVNDVVTSFLSVATESRHQYSIFCEAAAATQFQARGLPRNVRAIGLAPQGRVDRALVTLKHVLPIFGFIWRRPSRLERAAKSHGVELIWFVGGFFDTPDIPYITTVWDLQHLTHPWFPEVSSQWRWEYREFFLARHLRRAMAVICGTETGKAQLTAFYGLPAERIHILPHPTPAFALESSSENKPDVLMKFGLRRQFILYPAQFWAHKNHVNLLHGMQHCLKMTGNVPDLVLVGSDKGNRQFVQNKATELGLADKVHFLGFVTTDDLVTLYRNAAALVYPSFSGPENLPPLEAFALSCPVAIADYPGAKEQLGSSAWYFDPTNPESISAAIIRVLRKDAGHAAMIAAGRQRALSWTGKDFARRLVMLFNDLEAVRRVWR